MTSAPTNHSAGCADASPCHAPVGAMANGARSRVAPPSHATEQESTPCRFAS